MKSQKLKRMGRRRFLETLSTLGVSATAISFMSKETLAEVTDNPKDEVPRLSVLRHTNHEAVNKGDEDPKREPVYYTIPRDEWAYIEGVDNASERIRNRGIVNDDPMINTVVTTRVSGQHRERVVEVRHTSLEKRNGETVTPGVDYRKLRDEIPATINGQAGSDEHAVTVEDVPVTVKKRNLEEQAYYNDEYRPVPAGCEQSSADSNGVGTYGTPAYDNDINEFIWVTAGHCVGGDSAVAQQQPFAGSEIGYSSKVHVENGVYDAATVNKYDVSTQYDFADDSGGYRGWSIYGTVGRDELKDNVGNSDYKLYMQGRTTGLNAGKILAYDETTVAINVNSEGGDSGAPYFKKNSYDNTYIAGIHAWGTDEDVDNCECADDANGTVMAEIEDRWNLSL